MNIRLFLFAILLLPFFTSCTTSSFDNPTSTGTSEFIEVTPQEGELQMTPTPFAADDANLKNLIDKARDDLAQQLAIAPDQINLVEATEVEWTDSSLGCPQPGMEYLQVVTPGYRILLDVDGSVHEYHSNGDTYIVYCNPPGMPTLPKP